VKKRLVPTFAFQMQRIVPLRRGTFESLLGSTQSLMEAYVTRMEAQNVQAGLSFGQLGGPPL
jgi:hypothetical protein